ncbi:high affinity glucose transporter [Elasticomyces elasticus]|nr:high affinity glucose transporter [Elasticomyces elasticus]
MLIVGRIINGICVGVCSAQVLGHISELAPSTKRGRLVGAQKRAITWGIMIMFYISYGCSFMKGPAAFRVPWALQMIPAIILLFGMTFFPESPRWLASKDHREECERVLVLVHGHGDPDSPWVACESREIKDWLEIERQSKQISYLTLFTHATSTGRILASSRRSGRNSQLRGKAVAFTTSGNWAFNFALDYLVPPAFENITWRTYIIFGVFCVAMTFHVFFMYPETAGKPLEQVTHLFEDPSGIKHIGTPAWKTKNYYSTSARMEKGEGLEKQLPDDRNESPVRHETIDAEKAA